jgi:hypothetical protein
MSKLTKEDNDASLLAMENHLFYHLFDTMKHQPQAMYAFMDHGLEDHQVHHLANSCENTQPLHNSFTHTISTPPHSNGPTNQDIRIDQLTKRLQTATQSQYKKKEIVVLKIRFLYHVSYFKSTNLI